TPIAGAPAARTGSPVDPVAPESPERARPPKAALERAGPVVPVLVAPEPLRVEPEAPDSATPSIRVVVEPPAPPPVSATGTGRASAFPTPPLLEAVPAGPGRPLAGPPPGPPLPPRTMTSVALDAAPVVPESAVAPPRAPVLATERASPVIVASPVAPESPVTARRPEAPPVGPEFPESASGWAWASEAAQPVSPVLVADERATALPDLPVIAVGTTATLTAPPAPPPPSPTAMESALTT